MKQVIISMLTLVMMFAGAGSVAVAGVPSSVQPVVTAPAETPVVKGQDTPHERTSGFFDQMMAKKKKTNVLMLILSILFFPIAICKIYDKGKREWWEALIPIYGAISMMKILNLKPIKILLLLVPGLNVYLAIKWTARLGKAFGKGTGFIVGMVLLPGIFLPILAWGPAKYTKPKK